MDKRRYRSRTIWIAIGWIFIVGLISRCDQLPPPQISENQIEKTQLPDETSQSIPLVMADGDPYVRALMRMISKSESNDSSPYSLMYGGKHFDNLRRHPAKCNRIVNGPNMNKCSTAAGRYQMLDTTWALLSKRYHPHRGCILFVFQCEYSFEPQFQDQVTHAWLSDPQVWNMNIPELLKAGQLEKVRKRLSSTWTSLGYGIETNTMTSQLASMYEQFLKEELEPKKVTKIDLVK
jgi:muramidase (phage lysozyme)